MLKLTYETWVGLWLNVGRMRMQQAAAIMQGLGMAMGGGQLPREYFDAVAGSEEEVDDLEVETNARRAEAKALAEMAARMGQ